jgi:F0F1-type ATP synthase membrane subunit c/vacuolar-type H+-ATPase subunit K
MVLVPAGSRSSAILGFALSEAMALFALLVAFLILFVLLVV